MRLFERTSVVKQFEAVSSWGLAVAALCLSAGLAEPSLAEKVPEESPARAFLHVDSTQKPVVKGVLKAVPTHPDAAHSAYRPDSAVPSPNPLTSTTGPTSAAPKRAPALANTINIEGTASYSLAGSTGFFTADRVANHRSGGTSGTLRLELWATTNSPASGSVSGYQLAIDTLGTLAAGTSFNNINSGTFTYTQPASGCYYMSLLLTEFDGSGYPYVDYALFPNRVAFQGGSCSGPPPSCTEDAYTMCLVNGRYKVTSTWKNQYAGGATATLSKARLTDVTGAFWIANPSTYEYMIRVNTATDNGRAWMTILTFTSVEFWVDVTDTKTGQFKEYHSAPGNVTLIYDPSFFVYP
jgi:hypothetical protein